MSRYGKISKRNRQLSNICVVALLLYCLSSEAWHTHTVASLTSSFWLLYSAYALIAALFAGVGSLIWLYGYRQQPRVATLLFAFCSLMMVATGTLSAPSVGDEMLVGVGSGASALAVLSLLLLLLCFPVDILILSRAYPRRHTMLLFSLAALMTLCLLSAARSLCVYAFHLAIPSWWNLLGLLYYLIAGLACIVAIVFAARHTSTIRIQQQTRLFFVGTLLSFSPILVLTILPTILHLRVSIDGTLTMCFLAFFPLFAGYSACRYSILIFDSYIRRTVVGIVGGVGIALLAYLLFTAANVLGVDHVSPSLAALLGAGTVGAPLVWALASRVTEYYFFPETRHYQRLLAQTQQTDVQQTLNRTLIAQSLLLDTKTTLKSPESALFLLDDETDAFVLTKSDDQQQERLQAHILTPLAAYLVNKEEGPVELTLNVTFFTLLQDATRPFFLSDVQSDGYQRTGLARFVHVYTPVEHDMLIAPIRSNEGQLIGILVVAPRGDEHYGGPDLEVLATLVKGRSAALQTARMYDLATRQQRLSTHELAEAYEQQRQLSAIKDELIESMSHELRTPLAEVSGYLELLTDNMESLDSDTARLFLQKAVHGCDELLVLATSIVEAARAGSVTARPELTPLVVEQIVREEIENIEPKAAGEHTICQNIPVELVARGNAQSVHQVIRNLLSNALKYAPPSTTITIQGTSTDSTVRLCVQDQGPGIPPDEQSLLFSKFTRLKRDVSGAIRGTGLGLYICKNLMEAMEGRIWVESSGIEGEGSCFYVELPRGEPERNARVECKDGQYVAV